MENFSDTRILLVERDDEIRNLFEMFLSWQGYSVFAAREPGEALETIYSTSPHVIFSSLVFCDMDGFNFCRKLRTLPQTKDALIVALTGYFETDVEQRTLDAGFDKFLLKPISIHDMVSLIEEYRRSRVSEDLLQV